MAKGKENMLYLIILSLLFGVLSNLIFITILTKAILTGEFYIALPDSFAAKTGLAITYGVALLSTFGMATSAYIIMRKD